MAEEHGLIRNLVFRLVRRHIAGSTMNSALNAVKALNGKGMGTTLTFLSEHVNDQLKARYNSNTYMQMIKQISRLHLDSSVSVRLSQIGFAAGNGYADRHLDELMAAARQAGTMVWLEGGAGVDTEQLIGAYSDRMGDYDNIGVEVPLSHHGNPEGTARMVGSKGTIRITPHQHMANGIEEEEKPGSGALDRYVKTVQSLISRSSRVCVQEPNDHLISRIAAYGKAHRRDLIFGIPFGYGSKKVKRLEKMKLKLDVYVPYGKDWTPYAIYGLAGPRMRGVALKLLNGQNYGGEDGSI